MRTNLAQVDIVAAAAALSAPRLSSYKRFFLVSSDEDAYGIHRWNEALSGFIFKCVSTTEIVLRNRIHEVMSAHYGTAGWVGSRDWYNHIQLGPVSVQKIQEVTHICRRGRPPAPRSPAPTPDDVISRQTFGFWTTIFEAQTDIAGRSIKWPDLFPQIFVGHRQRVASYWGVAQRDGVLARLKTCNNLRNRIAHHEPLWKWGELKEEKMPRRGSPPPMTVALGPRTPQEAMDRLTLMHDRIVELLGWCSPSLRKAYLQTEAYAQFKSINSLTGLRYYQEHGCSAIIDLSRFRALPKLKKSLKSASKKKGLLLIKQP